MLAYVLDTDRLLDACIEQTGAVQVKAQLVSFGYCPDRLDRSEVKAGSAAAVVGIFQGNQAFYLLPYAFQVHRKTQNVLYKLGN